MVLNRTQILISLCNSILLVVFFQVVSRYVQPGVLENISLNVVDYEGIRYALFYTSTLPVYQM